MPFIVTVLKPKGNAHGALTSPDGTHYDLEPDDETAFLTIMDVEERVYWAARNYRLPGEPYTTDETIRDILSEEEVSTVSLPRAVEIRVEPIGWRRIEDDLGYHLGLPEDVSQEDAIAKWNEMHP